MTNTEDGALGKLVKGFTWQYAAVVNAQDLEKFWVDQTLELDFGITDFTEVPATVTEIRTDDSSENGIVFFQCNFASGQLLRLRSHAAQVNFQKYSGLRISKKAASVSERRRGCLHPGPGGSGLQDGNGKIRGCGLCHLRLGQKQYRRHSIV